MKKHLLLASFIFPERLNWFYGYLEKNFHINKNNVFVFKNLEDESKLITTFRFILNEGEKINFKELFPNALNIHKKGNCLYTINALNSLIELEVGENVGNVDKKSVIIDWSKFQNRLLTIEEGVLKQTPIEKIN